MCFRRYFFSSQNKCNPNENWWKKNSILNHCMASLKIYVFLCCVLKWNCMHPSMYEKKMKKNRQNRQKSKQHATALNVIKAIITLDCLIFGIFKVEWSNSLWYYYYLYCSILQPVYVCVFNFVLVLLCSEIRISILVLLTIWFECVFFLSLDSFLLSISSIFCHSDSCDRKR